MSFVAWNTAFAVVSITIIVTNSFTIFIFTRRQFKRKLSHFLSINLAVTDLVVGVIALPLYVSLLNHPGEILNKFYQFFDITAGLTSVTSIALISLERLYSVGWPWKHRLLNRKHYVIGVAFTWMYAMVCMVFLNFIYETIINAHVLIWGMGLPLLATFIACVLMFVMKKRSERNLQRTPNSQKDKKLVQSLLMVVVVFWLMWLPFTIINITFHYSCIIGKCGSVSHSVILFSKIFQYSNSFANPVIYAFRLQGFRSTIKDTFYKRRWTPPVVRGASPAISRMPKRLELRVPEIKNTASDL